MEDGGKIIKVGFGFIALCFVMEANICPRAQQLSFRLLPPFILSHWLYHFARLGR